MAKKRKEADASLTLAQLSDLYLAWMDRAGKSSGTIFSYGMELKTAQAELGADTLVASITPEQITTFNESKRVTKLKSGKPKAQPSIDKTRRVLRLAFAWAAENGIIASSPYAATETPSEEPTPEPAPAPTPKKQRKTKRDARAEAAAEVIAEAQLTHNVIEIPAA